MNASESKTLELIVKHLTKALTPMEGEEGVEELDFPINLQAFCLEMDELLKQCSHAGCACTCGHNGTCMDCEVAKVFVVVLAQNIRTEIQKFTMKSGIKPNHAELGVATLVVDDVPVFLNSQIKGLTLYGRPEGGLN